MYEIDFLPVESEEGLGSKSGDAIAVHWKDKATSEDFVVVIDGGFTEVGDDLADHIQKHYGTTYLDLVVSTHPDADHINGIARLLERLKVGELLLHQPALHHNDVSDFSNLEAIDNLIAVAKKKGTTVTEPFTGLSRFGGRLLVLGPTEEYYEELVAQHIEEEQTGAAAKRATVGARVAAFAKSLLEYTLDILPVETLADDGETGPRNNSSVITLFQLDDRRLLFTGDAGIPALAAAADFYEAEIGSFPDFPLRFIQAPHHGSKRNLGPTILDRILGPRLAPYAPVPSTAFISSARASKKHPSPKVVNALSRRGCGVSATEGGSIRHGNEAPNREGWGPIDPLPPLREDTDDD